MVHKLQQFHQKAPDDGHVRQNIMCKYEKQSERIRILNKNLISNKNF
jgi:hypothetical protein